MQEINLPSGASVVLSVEAYKRLTNENLARELEEAKQEIEGLKVFNESLEEDINFYRGVKNDLERDCSNLETQKEYILSYNKRIIEDINQLRNRNLVQRILNK